MICTLNRADALGATLECLQHQDHEEFEVIVVNGPSTDRTLEVLEPWREHIRYRDNPERNLSISRNIGIRASVGDLVAFIDDDALPEPAWLTQAIPAFEDPEVAGAGGIVFDHTGMDLQYRYTSTDRLLRTFRSEHESSLQCFPGTFQWPYLQGTNQIYRYDRLLDLGGFDENIFFYGDDCDIAGRAIDAGWVVRQLATSPVHHKFLPSGIRDHQRVTTNWFPVVHDHTYFCLRHASPYISEDEILHSIHAWIHTRVADTQMHQDAGRLPEGSTVFAEATCLRAFADAVPIGQAAVGTVLPRLEPEGVEFHQFPTLRNAERRRLVFVSSSYSGNITGGIGRLMSDLAPAMAERGHDVRVITRAVHAPPAVDFEAGVWVHRIAAPALPPRAGTVPDASAPINEFATAAAAEVRRVLGWTEPDLVFAPMWDVEAIGVLRETDLPVAIHVSTPLAIIGPMAGFVRNDVTDAPELRRLAELEAEVMATADRFQANTTAVVETIRSHYNETCGDDRWQVLNIGLKDQDREAPAEGGDQDALTVFFAGRFERRKGIDTVTEAMERVLADRPDVRLVLAGEDRALEPGCPAYGSWWIDRHRHEPWIRQVSLLGVIDDERLHAEYAGADIVVLPSRYESFGLVMVEAMMHGKALVTTDTSGVREFLRDGVDALMIQPGDVDALDAAVRRLLDDRDERARLGAAARANFDEHLAIDKVAARFEDFFQPLTSNGGRKVCEQIELASGDELPVDVRDRAAVTVVVLASEPTRLRVEPNALGPTLLEPGERRRLRLDVTTGRASVVVEQGRVVVERIAMIQSQRTCT